jgi:hypothetical protein
MTHTLPVDHFTTEPGRDRFALVLHWARLLRVRAVWVEGEKVCAEMADREETP